MKSIVIKILRNFSGINRNVEKAMIKLDKRIRTKGEKNQTVEICNETSQNGWEMWLRSRKIGDFFSHFRGILFSTERIFKYSNTQKVV